jgi:predicted negative regulator of RcsB-dependent stress response
MGDGAGAEKELARAGRLGAVDAELSLALARALLLERKYQEALDQLAKVPADPPSATARVLQGEAYLGLGQREEARAAFNQALEADPGSAAARLGLASLAIAEGRAEAADQQVKLALEKSPDDFRALMLSGELLLARRELEPAEAAFARALAASGERSGTARLALARAKLARGDLDGASAQVDQALIDGALGGDQRRAAAARLLGGEEAAGIRVGRIAAQAAFEHVDVVPVDREVVVQRVPERREEAHAGRGELGVGELRAGLQQAVVGPRVVVGHGQEVVGKRGHAGSSVRVGVWWWGRCSGRRRIVWMRCGGSVTMPRLLNGCLMAEQCLQRPALFALRQRRLCVTVDWRGHLDRLGRGRRCHARTAPGLRMHL